jgi:PAS domain S-box-containing protein
MPTAKKVRALRPDTSAASKYEVIVDQMSDAILTVDSSGRIDAANHAAEELTGYVREELTALEAQSLFPRAGQHRIPERARPLSAEMFRIPGTFEDVAFLRKDGIVGLVDLSVRQVGAAHEGSYTIALLRDVSEKKRMERELLTKHAELRNAYLQLEKKNAELESAQQTLVQAGKMAALGELAAGIAHELNQPLQGIRGYAQELQGQFRDGRTSPEERDLCLKEIVSSVDKMSKIIGYLRTFVRKSTESFEETNVHSAIEEALKMLDRQFQARGITVERDFDSQVPSVYGNPLQLEQVFINLATNARDAIEATGRGKGQIRIQTRKQGKLVEIRFSDDGTGMSDRVKEKAFNPFFTTKEVGKGMGLGLSLSYGMVSKLHGTIVVESEIGKGTTFVIRIPQDWREA